MRDVQMEKVAAQFYNPELPYHNFGHITQALDAGEEILDRCQERGVNLDEAVVYYAILFHDAGYHENHGAKGFTHKEEYSAQIAAQALTRKGLADATLAKIQQAILATRKGCEVASTNEIKAVRAADLFQLAADFPTFRTNTVNLWREYEMMSGKRIPWLQWREKVEPDVEYYLKGNLFVEPAGSPEEENGFLTRARRNLAALKADPN